MPRINSTTLEQHKLPTGNYGYSAVRLDDLGATEYTLVTIVQDESGSVEDYRKNMEACLKEIVKACKYSPRADNLILRFMTFRQTVTDQGFKLLSQINLGDFDGCLSPGGGTALFDATENAIAATDDFGKKLGDQDYNANAILFIITDGDDNSSALGATDVKKALQKATKSEHLESVVSVLIGVGMAGQQGIKDYLNNFHKDAGLAKLAAFVTKSISAQSAALGTKGPSNQLALTI
jgi:uncharacterized protein YegL